MLLQKFLVHTIVLSLQTFYSQILLLEIAFHIIDRWIRCTASSAEQANSLFKWTIYWRYSPLSHNPSLELSLFTPALFVEILYFFYNFTFTPFLTRLLSSLAADSNYSCLPQLNIHATPHRDIRLYYNTFASSFHSLTSFILFIYYIFSTF